MTPDLFRLQCLLLKVPSGRVTTYKALAHAMGTRGYRYVGQLLHRNPDPDRFPCCKVVRSDGSLGGYALGAKAKIARLRKEGIRVKNGKVVAFQEKIYLF